MCKIFFIEGPDYSGKTTLIDKIKKTIKNINIMTLKEPGYEMRTMLLDKDRALNSQTRRLLFAASHIEVMSDIYKNKDKYDIILVDRSAIVSDIVYSAHEDGLNEQKTKAIKETFTRVIKIYKETDEAFFDNFFRNNSELILLNVDERTFKERLNSRAIDKKDINDSKSDEFKWKIRDSYADLSKDEDVINFIVPDLFKKMHIIQSDIAGGAFHQFYNILCEGDTNV